MKSYVGLVVVVLALATGCSVKSAPQLNLGDKVIVKPGQLGIVISNFAGQSDWSYEVLVRDRKIWIQESELQLYQLMDWNEVRNPVIPKCILDAAPVIEIVPPAPPPDAIMKPSKPIKKHSTITPANMYYYKDLA
jgi:hypothetical protein